ncbi:haloacid dehalogenase type II [Aneurinibacillus sp. Ricciae_BoGa-3]|uniref:haloacid dehalogenase type II n=1 Tax=Aneurinibacillus sp. Ricciae_BoGa-3 TaxID=3022697 RepID=UPI0023412229|nr:haloacid dehalogenase type II [Aneurinibacillus sp. Ricciae_BoGa-3]WCK56268.1 haloacid dehalogenase type II [Aneurinibacillus sp. Ricciae_BoGa-3]
MSISDVKTIIFDVYGTLFDVHSVIQKCEELYPGRGQQISELWRTKQLDYAFTRHIIGRYRPFDEITKNALQYVCEQLGVSLTGQNEQELLQAYLKLSPYEEVPQALKQLAGSYQLAVLSNGSPSMLLPLVEYHQLNPYFSQVITVDDVKQYKPSPAAYNYALEQLDCRREEVLFLSSNTWDITGAASFGFQTAWVNRKNAVFDYMGQKPKQIISNLDELVSIM